MGIVESEIGQLEKTVNTLIRRPRLIRRDYWVSEIEHVLERPGIPARYRQRLWALLDLLATVANERWVQASAEPNESGNGDCHASKSSTSFERTCS
ncbi:hypothetical protein [Paraburkholderia xenovorans]|uniref:hypothetical protein n=1 Tax=Paraburkholderia xenovorans TaxID=36873 RepID=UPI0038BCC2BA